jgi:hypothetical protein
MQDISVDEYNKSATALVTRLGVWYSYRRVSRIILHATKAVITRLISPNRSPHATINPTPPKTDKKHATFTDSSYHTEAHPQGTRYRATTACSVGLAMQVIMSCIRVVI